MGVFYNPGEFAVVQDFTIGKDLYTAPVILEAEGTKERTVPESNHGEGLYRKRITMYVALSALGKVPRKKTMLILDGDRYQIVQVATEDGQIILTLEAMAE